MHLSRAARPALAAEIGPAVTAEQLGGQQIIVLGHVTCQSLFVLRQLLLHPVKEVLRYNGGYAVRDYHITVTELAHIAAVVQHVLYGIEGQLASSLVGNTFPVRLVPLFLHSRAAVIPLESLQNKWCCQRIDLKMLLVIDYITNRQTAAVKFAFQSIVCHAPDDLFGKVGGVVFRITFQNRFQNDTLRALGNDLCSGYIHGAAFQCFLLAGCPRNSGRRSRLSFTRLLPAIP